MEILKIALITLAALAGLTVLIIIIRAIKTDMPTKDEVDEVAHKPFVYPSEEVIDVAALYDKAAKEGVTFKAMRRKIRDAVRDFRAHGTHIVLINRLGLYRSEKVKGWITQKGKLVAFAWGGK